MKKYKYSKILQVKDNINKNVNSNCNLFSASAVAQRVPTEILGQLEIMMLNFL